jgi:zinc transporter ZupT
MTIALLIGSVVLAVFTVLWVKPTNRNRLKLLIAFSGSYLLSITALHLLPEVFASTRRGAYFGAFILVGFFLQVMLEYLSEGIEHGHEHHDKTSVVPIALIVGLCLHAFLEGMPLVGAGEGHDHGHDHSHSHDHGHSHDVESWQSGLLWGIVLHKYPVAMVFLSMLLNSGMRRPKAFLLLMVFGAMAPLGTLFAGAGIIGGFHKEILAIVVGIFLHVSTTILFESNEGHKFNAYKMLAVTLGLALAGLGMIFHLH